MEFFWNHLSFDIPAFFMTFAAMYLSWRVYTTSTFHRVKLIDFSAGFSESSDHCGPSMTVQIKNVGLPIHNLAVWFSYDRENQKGGMRYAMSANSLGNPIQVFEKGMSVEMAWNPNVDQWLERWIPLYDEVRFANPRRQRASIVICSGDFEVLRIPLVPRGHWFLAKWNSLASRVNFTFRKETDGSDFGVGRVSIPTILPRFGLNAVVMLKSFGDQFSKEIFERYSERQKENTQRLRELHTKRRAN